MFQAPSGGQPNTARRAWNIALNERWCEWRCLIQIHAVSYICKMHSSSRWSRGDGVWLVFECNDFTHLICTSTHVKQLVFRSCALICMLLVVDFDKDPWYFKALDDISCYHYDNAELVEVSQATGDHSEFVIVTLARGSCRLCHDIKRFIEESECSMRFLMNSVIL